MLQSEKAKAQWLAMELGMDAVEIEEALRKRRKIEQNADESVDEGEASLPVHLDVGVPAAVMDKVTIVGCHGCEEALTAARAVRELRTMYVDDLRLWLQLMEPASYKEWLGKKGVKLSVSTPYVALNNTQLLGGTAQLIQSLPYWRGDKIARDVECPSLVLIHIPYMGLSSASAVVGDRNSGHAYVINPRRDTRLYTNIIEAEGLTLKGVLMTHLPWDGVGGHAVLQRATSCSIYMGQPSESVAGAERCYESIIVKEEKVLIMGDVCIRCIPTPGHTNDSMCYAVTVDDKEVAAFTGCSLLIDTVGRVDIESKLTRGSSLDSAHMSSLLYDSLAKICCFDDDCVVFPSHCGMQFGGHTVEPKWSCKLRLMYDGSNHALSLIPGHKKSSKEAGKSAFIEHLTSLSSVSIPFSNSFRNLYYLNVHGEPRNHTLREADSSLPPILTLQDFIKEGWDASKVPAALRAHLEPHEEAVVEIPLLLDVRPQGAFCDGYVKGSLAIPMLEGVRFEAFAAAIISRHSFLKITVVVESRTRVPELMYRLGLVALDTYVEKIVVMEGSEGYTLPALKRISGDSDTVGLQGEELMDVRSAVENSSQAVASSVHVPLESVKEWAMANTHRNGSSRPIVTYCAGGYRSFIAATLLNTFSIPSTDVSEGGLTIMSHRPDLWALKDPSIKCTS